MKKLLTIIIYFLYLGAEAQDAYWQQQVNYTIEVTLNDIEHSLEAFEKITYINNSPDTLHFIWFHCWPNAYKNDKTAFSEQLLLNGRTDFYFSGQEARGYINRLDFRVNGVTATMEDHPRHIDIIKLILPQPLAPGDSAAITTPFHVQLPHNFSRGGHVKQSYQVTQWYPKPAVYDRKGWHPMPYLDQGEFYSEFGNYDVRITVPANYVVAATGELQDTSEIQWLQKKASALKNYTPDPSVKNSKPRTPEGKKTPPEQDAIPSDLRIKSLHYRQDNVHDFAWFADKRFLVDQDTLFLPSGRKVRLYSFCLPSGERRWKHSIRYMKQALLSWSEWLGEYPYKTVSAVEAAIGFTGGMEYPTITSLSPMPSSKALESTLAHELGHNWFYGILSTNERMHPWMDEGINTYYDSRYADRQHKSFVNKDENIIRERWIPRDYAGLLASTVEGIKKDQPINTVSAEFTPLNYNLVAYYKTGEWMKRLEAELGTKRFDTCMQSYFEQWRFKHPYPEDFKNLLENVSGKNLDQLFNQLSQKGSLDTQVVRKKIRPAVIFNFSHTKTTQYINIMPAVGINAYDGFMIGALVHNYQLPLPKFRFLVAPLYGFGSAKLNGLARASYTWFPDHSVYKVDIGAAASTFSMDDFKPEGMKEWKLRFTKLAPFIRITLQEHDPLSKVERYLQFKSFFIREDKLRFDQSISGTDTTQTVSMRSAGRQLTQLKFVVENSRVLYPYKGEIQLEQQKDFIRATLTTAYFFNYASRQGGLNLRFFAGKFVYLGAKTVSKQFNTDRYHLNLSGPNGFEDYTYSNYFVGRSESGNWASHQMMMRDGGFKVRTDMLSDEVGKTDDWLLAANFVADIPKAINPLQVLPFRLPLKIFADVGSYAGGWKKNAGEDRFLFDAGLQLSLLKETVNIYIPLVYSQVFKDYFRSTLGNNRFWKTISFSIDIQQFSLKKLDRNIPF